MEWIPQCASSMVLQNQIYFNHSCQSEYIQITYSHMEFSEVLYDTISLQNSHHNGYIETASPRSKFSNVE